MSAKLEQVIAAVADERARLRREKTILDVLAVEIARLKAAGPPSRGTK